LKFNKETWTGYCGHIIVVIAGVIAIAYYVFGNKNEVMDVPKHMPKK